MKESEGKVVPDRKEKLTLGSYPELCGKTTWLPTRFARIPNVPALELRVVVSKADQTRELTVQVPNLYDPSLQKLGVEVAKDYRFRLKLGNELGGETVSTWQELA